MDLGLLYRALNAHQVDVIAANSTDGPIKAFGLTVLEDDRHYFPPYQAVPLVRDESLRRWPQIQNALNALAGFAFAKYKFPGRTVLFYLVLATLMVPFQITMIPTYVTVAKLGLINNYWGVILPGTASAFGIFLVRQFMQSIPDELLDAARIDGCSDFQKHRYISIPGLRPQIVFVAVISSLAALKVFDEIYVLTNRSGGIEGGAQLEQGRALAAGEVSDAEKASAQVNKVLIEFR